MHLSDNSYAVLPVCRKKKTQLRTAAFPGFRVLARKYEEENLDSD